MAKNEVRFQVIFDGLDKASKSILKAAGTLDDFGKSAERLGKNLSQVGSTISFLGAGISGPLVLAFKNAAKSSVEVSTEVEKLNKITAAFQREIATAILPVIQKFTNVLGNLVDGFQKLDQGMKSQLLQGALIAGVFLTLSGVLTVLVAKIIGLVGNVAQLAAGFAAFAVANPILLAIAVSLGALIFLMVKFDNVATPVLNAIQVGFLNIQIQVGFAKVAFESFVSVGLDGLAKLYQSLASAGGPSNPFRQFYQTAANVASDASLAFQHLANVDILKTKEAFGELKGIVSGGEGSLAQGFDDVKKNIEAMLISINSLGDNAPGKFGAFVLALEDLKKKSIEVKTTFEIGFGNALAKMATEGKKFDQSMKEVFKSMAESFIAEVGRMIAKWLALLALKAIGKALLGVSKGSGNVQALNRGTPGVMHLASGSDTIPAMLSPGEMVIPKSFSSAIRSGELTLSGKGNRSETNSVIFDFTGASFNGINDSLVKDIFTKASEGIRSRILAPLPS